MKDHLIGQDIDGTMSGISGGERRRVSVGISLVTDALAIFLDEPTTGLDSESAEQLMQLLSRLANNRGKTVRCPLLRPKLEAHGGMHGSISPCTHDRRDFKSSVLHSSVPAMPWLGLDCPDKHSGRAEVGWTHALQVVCTIHQPSSDICSLFDDAMLLSGEYRPAHTLQAHHSHRSRGTAIVLSARPYIGNC